MKVDTCDFSIFLLVASLFLSICASCHFSFSKLSILFRESSKSSAFSDPANSLSPSYSDTIMETMYLWYFPVAGLGFVFIIPSIRNMLRKQILDMYDCTFPESLFMVADWQFLSSHPCNLLVVALNFGFCVVEFASYSLLQSQIDHQSRWNTPSPIPIPCASSSDSSSNKASPNRHPYSWRGLIFHQLL